MKSTKTIYKDVTFRSWNEATFAEWLDNQGISWIYEPCTFNESFVNSTFGDIEKVRYTPDFFLPDFNTYLELKPSTGNGHIADTLKQSHKIQLLRENLGINILQVSRTKKFHRVHYSDGSIGKWKDFLEFLGK